MPETSNCSCFLFLIIFLIIESSFVKMSLAALFEIMKSVVVLHLSELNQVACVKGQT
jgi:hypothetical protein